VENSKKPLISKLTADHQFAGLQVLCGFDAFVDLIYHVVDERIDASHYDRFSGITAFSDRIRSAAGRSANLELVLQQQKPGGNAAIFAICASALGAQVIALAPVGEPETLALFSEAAPSVQWVSLGSPGLTNALEFPDGKLMLGNVGITAQIGWECLNSKVGEARFFALLKRSNIVLLGNWTMNLGLGSVLERISRIEPGEISGPIFLDLADPRKRSLDDLQMLILQMRRLAKVCRVILGLNCSEAEQVSGALGQANDCSENGHALMLTADRLRESLELEAVVIHATRFAAGASRMERDWVHGPFQENPRITTGAGDHFNGGFALAIAAKFNLREALYCGVAASGFYVRTATSGAPNDLANVLASMP